MSFGILFAAPHPSMFARAGLVLFVVASGTLRGSSRHVVVDIFPFLCKPLSFAAVARR
jgi:hypothetical protein